MQRYFVQLSFKGTYYNGWQIQPNALTIQDTLEGGLSMILREEIKITGAGRTDSGVHATFFIFHFDSINEEIDTGKLLYRLNRYLPADIALQKIWKVPQDAHARYSAISRTYKYLITLKKDPFKTDTSLYLAVEPDIIKMNEAMEILKQYSDFTSFSRLHTDVKTNICKIFSAEWRKEDGLLVFTIEADRFLRNMVRAIIGTVLKVGQGKISIDEFSEIIEAKDRKRAGDSAPAHGLFLVEIKYPEEFL
jgi:tRNA pseudouridine38-40 synthase